MNNVRLALRTRTTGQGQGHFVKHSDTGASLCGGTRWGPGILGQLQTQGTLSLVATMRCWLCKAALHPREPVLALQTFLIVL